LRKEQELHVFENEEQRKIFVLNNDAANKQINITNRGNLAGYN
jgi:hypothetical protein